MCVCVLMAHSASVCMRVNVFEVIWYAVMLLTLLTLKQRPSRKSGIETINTTGVRGQSRQASGCVDQEEGALTVRQKEKQDRE